MSEVCTCDGCIYHEAWNMAVDRCASFLAAKRVPPGTTVHGMYGLIEKWEDEMRLLRVPNEGGGSDG